MPITLLTGVPGSGKTTRLVELLQDASASGRRVQTFFCSDAPGLATNEPVSVHRVIASRRPGLVYPIDHLVTAAEAGEILRAEPPGTLVAFEESQWFGREIVSFWLQASRRGLEVVAATPSGRQLAELQGHDYRVMRFALTCSVCGRREATGSVPGGEEANETVGVCDRCRRKLRRRTVRDLRTRLRARPPEPGKRVLQMPIELRAFRTWRVAEPGVRARTATLEALAHVARRDGPEQRPTALVLGCETGYFAHRLRQDRRRFFPVVGVDEDVGAITVARLVDGHFHIDSNTYLSVPYEEFLHEHGDARFDLVVATQPFTETIGRLEPDARAKALAAMVRATAGICLVEAARGPDGDWLRTALPLDPAIAQFGELDDHDDAASTVLVGVTADLVWWARKELAALGGRCAVCKKRFGRRRVPDVRSGSGDLILACDRCIRRLRGKARRRLRSLGALPPDAPSPVWERLQSVARAGGIAELGRPLGALVLGCGTGELCRRLDDWGATPVVGVDPDPEAISAARIAEAYLRDHHVAYVDATPGDYLRGADSSMFDLVYVARPAVATLEPEHVDALTSRTSGLCVFEVDPDHPVRLQSAFADVVELPASSDAPALLVASRHELGDEARDALAKGAQLCGVCARRASSYVVPDVRAGRDLAPLAICKHCLAELRRPARAVLAERLRAGEPRPGEEVLEYPVEVRDFSRWRVETVGAEAVWRELQTLVRAAGLPELARTLSVLVLGSSTGFYCRRFHDWGFWPVAGVEADESRLVDAQIVDAYLRDGRVAYSTGPYESWLAREVETLPDVVFASSRFTGDASLELLAAAAARAGTLCVFECGDPQTATALAEVLDGGEFLSVRTLALHGGTAILVAASRVELPQETTDAGQLCEICGRRPSSLVAPDVRAGREHAPVAVCRRCARRLRRRARRVLAAELRLTGPEPGKRVLAYPFPGVRGWQVADTDAEGVWESVQTAVRLSGIALDNAKLSAVVFGSSTGFFCRRFYEWGFEPVAGVEEDRHALVAAQIAETYLGNDRIAYSEGPHAEAVEGEADVDVVLASRSFSTRLAAAAAARTRGVAVFECADADTAAEIVQSLAGFPTVKTLRLPSGTNVVVAIRPELDKDAQYELDQLAYPALVARVRELVLRTVPAGTAAAVVSHGDDRLLELDGRRGLHFPQLDDGTYAGYYPATSEEAIEHLEELHGRGAEYLVVPAPQLWWLDHYAELREFLERSGEEIVRDPAGLIYALAGAPGRIGPNVSSISQSNSAGTKPSEST
jgi:SAM-dependent methyltransferase